MNRMLSIDSTKCIQCGFCADECPNYVFNSTPNGMCKQVEIKYPEQCCACGHCVAICPSEAIRHAKMSVEKFKNLTDIEIPPQHMRSLLLSRRSVRTFKEEPVSDELVTELIETGIHAGTASNGQTEGFVVIRDRKALAELERMVIDVLWEAGLKHLGSGVGRRLVKTRIGGQMLEQVLPYYHIINNRRKNGQLEGMIFRNAPVVIMSHGLRTNPLAPANCAIASRNMEIMAQTLGLGTCWVGFLVTAASYSGKIGSYIGIPPNRKIYSAILVGYPKHDYNKMIPRKDREIRWI